MAKSQDELPVRRMSDSYREAVIPLGSDPKVTEKYLNFYKGIRFGRILEDLDTFAGTVGFVDREETGGPNHPLGFSVHLPIPNRK